jgi:hypothetical protein
MRSRMLPEGATWQDSVFNPRKVARLRRQQAEREAGPGFTKKKFDVLCKKYGNRCVCCGAKDTPLEPDHIEPLCRGGEHHIRNIQPLCGECNNRKRTQAVDYRPTDVRAWLRRQIGMCCVGSATKTPCKNLALDDGSGYCYVHKHQRERVVRELEEEVKASEKERQKCMQENRRSSA